MTGFLFLCQYVVYDLMTEMRWNTDPVVVSEWISKYHTRRYGAHSRSAQRAWEILSSTVYKSVLLFAALPSPDIQMHKPSQCDCRVVWRDQEPGCLETEFQHDPGWFYADETLL